MASIKLTGLTKEQANFFAVLYEDGELAEKLNEMKSTHSSGKYVQEFPENISGDIDGSEFYPEHSFDFNQLT